MQWVVILIDIGSIHNFVDPFVANKAQLLFNVDDKVRVKVANGEQIVSEGSCTTKSMLIQGTMFTMDAFVLLLVGYNVFLGV